MSGPIRRFWAMHRWWLALLVLIGWTFYGIMQNQSGGGVGWITLGIAAMILWVPTTALIVLFPRLRGLSLVMFVFVVASPFIDLGGIAAHWVFAIIFTGWMTVFFVLQKVKITFVLRGRILINRPVEEIAETIQYRETDTFWQHNVQRIVPHPDLPGAWRCHTAAPLNRFIAYFDAEIIEPQANGGFTARISSPITTAWEGSVFTTTLIERHDQTEVLHLERARANLVAAITLWFDKSGQDTLRQLKAYAEGEADWSIGAGMGRWWPTWRPAPDAAVF